MGNNAQEHINRIRYEKYWLDKDGRLKGQNPLASDLQDSIEHLSKGLYARNAHFIFELVQNAEDNTYDGADPSLAFELVRIDPTNTPGSHGAIIVRNNESGFSPKNVDAICAVGKSTKSKSQGYIGEKGIGFKSVFRVTSNPHILSNGYSFCLPEHDEATGLGYIVPTWINEALKSAAPVTTIILPLDKPDFKYDKIEKMLEDIEPETILFLSKIKRLEIRTDTGDSLTILKDDSRAPMVQILVDGRRHGKFIFSRDEFLLFTKTFPKPDDIVQEKRSSILDREVSVAFPLNKENERVGKVFAYLPVLSDTGLPFILNADFILTSSREEIQKDVPWNRWLVKCAARVVADSLPKLREKRALTVPLLESLARGFHMVTDQHVFQPIAEEVREALMNHELLPADDETFVFARNAKLARGADLRTLLNQDQFRPLFQSTDTIKWLAGEITEGQTPYLRTYLLNELHVEEVTPFSFSRKITHSFLAIQSDDWFIKFYEYLLSGHEALWRPPGRAGETGGLLRSEPILRLEDNRLVAPFGADGRANAYLPSEHAVTFPVVRRSIAEHEAALSFLKRLGLELPDEVADVIENVLPKYRIGSAPSINQTQYRADLQAIFDALKTDSRDKRERLSQAARTRLSLRQPTRLRECPHIRHRGRSTCQQRIC